MNIYRGGITFMTGIAVGAISNVLPPFEAALAVLGLATCGAFLAAAQEGEA